MNVIKRFLKVRNIFPQALNGRKDRPHSRTNSDFGTPYQVSRQQPHQTGNTDAILRWIDVIANVIMAIAAVILALAALGVL